MHSYHNVAKLRQFHGAYRARSVRPHQKLGLHNALRRSIPSPVDLDAQVPDLFPQRIPVETQKICGPDLIAPGRRHEADCHARRGRPDGEEFDCRDLRLSEIYSRASRVSLTADGRM
jgi:hypothetical protein